MLRTAATWRSGELLMNLTGNWNYPTSVRFGPGRIRELPDACAAAGMQRPLIVTDPGVSACR